MSRPLPPGVALPKLDEWSRHEARQRVASLVKHQGVRGALHVLEAAEERSWQLRDEQLAKGWHGAAAGSLGAALMARCEQHLLVEFWAHAA